MKKIIREQREKTQKKQQEMKTIIREMKNNMQKEIGHEENHQRKKEKIRHE